MDINMAKSTFKNILNSLSDIDRGEFLYWCEENYSDTKCSKAYFELRTIAEDIKSVIPLEAILPSEKVNNSRMVSDCDLEPVLHVDSFLCEEEHIDALVDEGNLRRNYCRECKSFNIAPITFISHSASIQRIEFIFRTMLPDLTDKVLLDVGSRLGAILYGAYYCSSAKKIIGVEINEDLCKLQNHMVDKYGLNDRIEIICSDICNVSDVIQSANIIIFNNVFECFMPLELQQKIWMWLRNIINIPGTVLVTIPSIEQTLKHLQTGIDVSSWLRQIPVESISRLDDPDLISDTYCYVVL